MRAFIAIDFKELEGYFKELQKHIPMDIAKIRPASSFHLTLKFLGEVPDKKIQEIKEILKTIKFNAFKIKTSDIGVFPTENYIRVIWVALKPEEPVLYIQKQIDEKLNRLFKQEKQFKAHITLARVKFVKEKGQFINKIKEIKTMEKEAEIKNFRLIKSTLTKQGPIYEDIEAFYPKEGV